MTQRADARRNREAILAAAETVFAAHTPQAPLQLVAEEAGVGRGTLYRHFPDRRALATAIYEQRLERYEAYGREYAAEPDVLIGMLRLVALDQMAIPGLFRIINIGVDESPPVAALWRRTVAAFSGPLEASKRAGATRTDVELVDLFLAISMLYGVANSPGTFPHDGTTVDRALAIIASGIGAVRPGAGGR
ncbi:MAG: TetR/AcrR family transcriptional regulator [Micrococcales bacterium]|nr:TetR/AcrR family transcriptional regulator [Micrococcales bacterium]